MGITLQKKQELANYRSTGFDYMRIILAVSVLGWHSIVTSYGADFQDSVQSSPWRMLTALILPMFFALSGYLVSGSLDRCKTLVRFLGLRAIRIFPALFVEVLLSAFILGVLFTNLPLWEYFAHEKFHTYLWNAVGHIHYELPGVFENNPKPMTVNGQLWTVPFELYCYIALAGLAAFGLHRHRKWFVFVTVLLAAAGLAAFFYKHGISLAYKPSNVPGFMLVICFLGGVAIARYADVLPWDKKWFAVSLVLSMGLLNIPVYGDLLAIVPICYATAFMGLANPAKISILKGADYSYGIFLYGYAIQQALMALSPHLHVWYLNLLFALPLAALMAAFSWHVVEKPALKLRKYLDYFEIRWIAVRDSGVRKIKGYALSR